MHATIFSASPIDDSDATGEPRRRHVPRSALVFCAYLITAFVLHAAGHNIWRELLGGGDGYTAGLPSKLFSPHLSAWNPYVQLGQFTFANTQFQPFYPPGLILMWLFPNTLGYNLFILGHYAMAGLFFYWFVRNLHVSRYSALFGGLVFMCCGFLTGHKGHQAVMSTAIWLPLMLLFADRFAASGRVHNAVFGGSALAMSILGGFPQMTVYGLMILVPYLVYRCMIQRNGQRSATLRRSIPGLSVFAVTGFLLSSLQLFAVAEALPYMTRQKISLQQFSEDSLPVLHFLAFLIPNLLGGFYGVPTYSSNPNVVELYGYCGLLPLSLAFLALWSMWRTAADVRFWTAVALGAGVLAAGLPAIQRLLYHVPVYNLFRAPSRHLYELDMALAVLSALGAERLISLPEQGRSLREAAIRWTCLTFTLLFGFVLMLSQAIRSNPAVLASLEVATLASFRKEVLRDPGVKGSLIGNLAFSHPTISCSIVFFFLTMALLVAGVRKRSRRFVLIILPFAVVGDIWSLYHTLYRNPDTANLYGDDRRSELAYLSARRFDKTHYRMYPVDPALVQTYPLLNMMSGISIINDYSPMWLTRYQRVTGFALNGDGAPEILAKQKLLSVLGAQYILAREPVTIERLRIVSDSPEIPVVALPVPSLSCPTLNCVLTSFPDAVTLTLASPDGQAVSIVHFPIQLQRSTYYKIEFEARATDAVQMPLIVDLYSDSAGRPVYDSPDQDRAIWAGTDRFIKYTLLINSGPFAPENAFVRLYTQSPHSVEVRNIRLSAALTVPEPAYVEEARTYDGIVIFRNSKALPRFRFASELLPAKDFDSARATLSGDASFDPARQVLVEGLAKRTTAGTGRILEEWIASDVLRWRVQTEPQSFFVVGDSWFPGWRATVDGHETGIQIVNGIVRGVFIDQPGMHTVEMSFRPRGLKYGLASTLLGVGLLVTAIFKAGRYSS